VLGAVDRLERVVGRLEIVEERVRSMKDLFLVGDLPTRSTSDGLRLRPARGIFHAHAGVDDSGK
jgi:hypothetical protein